MEYSFIIIIVMQIHKYINIKHNARQVLSPSHAMYFYSSYKSEMFLGKNIQQ